jgi:AP-1 complex subunit sigma 1/2
LLIDEVQDDQLLIIIMLLLLFSLSSQAYFILDELIMAGELQETSKKTVLRLVAQQDALQDNPNESKAVEL